MGRWEGDQGGPEPDPVSVWWEPAAAAFLARAYAAKGKWVGTRIADPSPRQAAALAVLGYSARAPDRPSALGGRRGGLNARTRWARSFVRAVYRANKAGPNRPIQLEVGRALPRRGVVPPGRPVRMRLRRGGSAAAKAVARKPARERIWVGEGDHGLRWSDKDLRDW